MGEDNFSGAATKKKRKKGATEQLRIHPFTHSRATLRFGLPLTHSLTRSLPPGHARRMSCTKSPLRPSTSSCSFATASRTVTVLKNGKIGGKYEEEKKPCRKGVGGLGEGGEPPNLWENSNCQDLQRGLWNPLDFRVAPPCDSRALIELAPWAQKPHDPMIAVKRFTRTGLSTSMFLQLEVLIQVCNHELGGSLGSTPKISAGSLVQILPYPLGPSGVQFPHL